MSERQALLLEVRGLKTHFFLREGVVRAVDGLSFDLCEGQTLGVIGESGCGKSVAAQSILRIVPSPPGRVVAGEILLHRPSKDGGEDTVDLAALDPRGDEIRKIRGKEIAMIFQEPMTSFGPLHTVGNQIMEAILIHQRATDKKQARSLATELLSRVGIPRPSDHVDAYPHQLSGGMRQRAMIAMALSCNPRLLIADEPTTALDVTIQAQILDLLRNLREEFGMAIICITHDLGVTAEIADTVAVMYVGKIVERAKVEEVFDNAKHPYTQALLQSTPRIDRALGARLPAIEGVVPDPYEIPPGCAFSSRCPRVMTGTCDQKVPGLVEVESGHYVRCFLFSNKTEEDSSLTA